MAKGLGVATTGNGLPKFLGATHLAKWLVGSADGRSVLAAANEKWLETDEGRAFVERVRNAEEWLRTSEEGKRLVAEAAKETTERPRVLVVLYGEREVEVYAEGNARINLVNVPGQPCLKDLTEKDVGTGWLDLTRGASQKKAGRSLSSLEIALMRKTVDAWEAAERAAVALGVALKLGEAKK